MTHSWYWNEQEAPHCPLFAKAADGRAFAHAIGVHPALQLSSKCRFSVVRLQNLLVISPDISSHF